MYFQGFFVHITLPITVPCFYARMGCIIMDGVHHNVRTHAGSSCMFAEHPVSCDHSFSHSTPLLTCAFHSSSLAPWLSFSLLNAGVHIPRPRSRQFKTPRRRDRDNTSQLARTPIFPIGRSNCPVLKRISFLPFLIAYMRALFLVSMVIFTPHFIIIIIIIPTHRSAHLPSPNSKPPKQEIQPDISSNNFTNNTKTTVPKYVFYLPSSDAFPKTASGKIQKFKLKEMAVEILKQEGGGGGGGESGTAISTSTSTSTTTTTSTTTATTTGASA